MDPFGIFFTLASLAMSMKQASDQRKAAQKQVQQNMDEQAKQSWKEYEKNEKIRKDQLRKALAKKRARMGAVGLSATDGSSGAIVQGLRTDAAEATHEDFTERKEVLDESVSGIQANLLEQSNAQKRKMYSKIGSTVGSVAGGLIADEDGMKVGKQIGGIAGSLA